MSDSVAQSPVDTTTPLAAPVPVPATPVDEKSEFLQSIMTRLQGIAGDPQRTAVTVVAIEEANRLIKMSHELFESEPVLLEVGLPCKLVGDTHGQFVDLLNLLNQIGRPPVQPLLFLGDYVDRGPQSMELLLYLLAMKCLHPTKCHLLRGNHETATVNRVYGFYQDCAVRYGTGIWYDFQSLFNWMPMAALVGGRVLAMHGGLSPELTSFEEVRKIRRPIDPLNGLAVDLLWSDPTNRGDGWFQSDRGLGFIFGRGIAEDTCSRLNVDLIVRAHQVVQDGYEIMYGRRVVTIFSAPQYCGEFNNAAAVCCLDADLRIYFETMRLPEDPARRLRGSIAAPSPSEAEQKADIEALVNSRLGHAKSVDANNNDSEEGEDQQQQQPSIKEPATENNQVEQE